MQFHVLSVEHAHRWKWRRLRREFDVVGIIADYVTEFYRATSKSLFLRLLSLDPPKPRSNPEEAMMWLWKTHNRFASHNSILNFIVEKNKYGGRLRDLASRPRRRDHATILKSFSHSSSG